MTQAPAAERLSTLEAQLRVAQAADDIIESAIRRHSSLDVTLTALLPLLVSSIRGDAAWVELFDESLELRTHSFGSNSPFPLLPDEVEGIRDESNTLLVHRSPEVFVVRRLAVDGRLLGTVAVAFNSPPAFAVARAILTGWSEVVDNYVSQVLASRKKALVLSSVEAAIRAAHTLDEAMSAALRTVSPHIEVDALLAFFRHRKSLHDGHLHYHFIRKGESARSSSLPRGPDADPYSRIAEQLDQSSAADVGKHFSCDFTHEEHFEIAGDASSNIAHSGRLIAARADDEVSPWDREILAGVSDHLRRAASDYDKEWSWLEHSFAPRDTRLILATPHYRDEILSPREHDLAVLFADISGFTRISETSLGSPSRIGKFIDAWSDAAVRVVWEEFGVFDKMVGDCIIAFWGPPHHRLSPEDACAHALRAAVRIRRLTREFMSHPEFPELATVDPPLGVATGLHYTRASVGCFGPDQDYTAFASGVNNTARLQGVARRDEILCMLPFVDKLSSPASFGPELEAAVKNVADPLRFRTYQAG